MIDLEAANKLVEPDYFQPRQWDILRLRLLGHSDKEIANVLGLHVQTIKNRIYEIKWIIGLPFHANRAGNAGLFAWAIENGLITINFDMAVTRDSND